MKRAIWTVALLALLGVAVSSMTLMWSARREITDAISEERGAYRRSDRVEIIRDEFRSEEDRLERYVLTGDSQLESGVPTYVGLRPAAEELAPAADELGLNEVSEGVRAANAALTKNATQVIDRIRAGDQSAVGVAAVESIDSLSERSLLAQAVLLELSDRRIETRQRRRLAVEKFDRWFLLTAVSSASLLALLAGLLITERSRAAASESYYRAQLQATESENESS